MKAQRRTSALFFLPILAVLQSMVCADVTIHVQRGISQPQPAIVSYKVSTRANLVRVKLTVKAGSLEIAQRAAIRYALAQRFQPPGVPSPLRTWGAQLASVAAQMNASQATVISQSKAAGGYTLEVGLKETQTDFAAQFRAAALPNLSIVTLLPEFVDGERAAAPLVETAVQRALTKQKFRVYDWNFVATNCPLPNLVQATVSGPPNELASLGTRLLANHLVAGRVDAKFSQDNAGIISYNATANVRVIRADSGEILTAQTWSEKGFGQTKAQAARKALGSLSATVAKELPAELLKRFPAQTITVQFDDAAPEQASEAERFLVSMPGMTQVTRNAAPQGTLFRCASLEKPAVLAALIEGSQNYRVTAIASD